MSKIVSTSEAIGHIKNGATVAIGGFIGSVHPEELTKEIENSFIQSKTPGSLTVVYAAGQGDTRDRGINHLAHKGLVKRVIGGHWALAPKMAKLALDNEIEAYNFPQGVISHLFRDIAAKKPGTITHVGIGTFVDPELSGGKVNSVTREDLVKVLNIDNKKWLFYRAFPVDVALIRGTTADADGNITMERETGSLEMLELAQAARNSGGIVIAQVERLAESRTLNPWLVKIPGILVDFIAVAKKDNHWQTYGEKYNPSLSGEIRSESSQMPGMELSEKKVICRRALKEIRENDVVNLGIGIPEGISIVANEKNVFDRFKLTVEAGIIGGLPAGGLSFGASYNPDCIISQPSQFDFYDGGGLDIAFLGMAQVDSFGNVNVSKFGSKLAGCGGFINITQNTKRVVFCGTFTSKGLETDISGGRLGIKSEGSIKKFIKNVEQITFNGNNAINSGHKILYITERCVFELNKKGILLTEIAPGIDLKKDILSQMEFKPLISENLKLMERDLFTA